MLEDLKEKVYKANMLLPKYGLVKFTWGNVSQIDRASGLFAIKPSGVPYNQLKPSDMVLVNLKGEVVEGELNPSSDTPTHAYLYNHFKEIGAIVHTHSPWAVSFAQAGIDLPAAGTTHADTFYGDVPVTAKLNEEQIKSNYELNTGVVIVKEFDKRHLDPMAIPAVLVQDHGPFTWGKDATSAVYNSAVLEEVAKMTYHSLMLEQLKDSGSPLYRVPQFLLDKHYLRKHGKNAYYGQPKKK